MKKKIAILLGVTAHLLGWVLGFWDAYMMRGSGLMDPNCWWGATMTALLAIFLLVVGFFVAAFSIIEMQ